MFHRAPMTNHPLPVAGAGQRRFPPQRGQPHFMNTPATTPRTSNQLHAPQPAGRFAATPQPRAQGQPLPRPSHYFGPPRNAAVNRPPLRTAAAAAALPPQNRALPAAGGRIHPLQAHGPRQRIPLQQVPNRCSAAIPTRVQTSIGNIDSSVRGVNSKLANMRRDMQFAHNKMVRI
ncbi:hypothetical protein WR25_05058 [Diploscapter pachys]|uniref:Uncharacterized protein n=1 Tax=Diploscapter pachys TaxID=2018661 RepID=A0A2A2K4V2_9BILA|nr:hypothetical protein WR25_05058 [Diploscapter pachys]